MDLEAGPKVQTEAGTDAGSGSFDSKHFSIDELTRQLSLQGFVVQEGAFEFFDLESCRDQPNCFGNNPTSPYGIYALPPAQGQLVREEQARSDGKSPTFRLREDEAILFVGETPPTSAYYSFRSYVFDRQGEPQERKPLFASLGDSLNQALIGTIEGEKFGAETLILTTANRDVQDRILSALRSAGVPSTAVNHDLIPASLCRMGLERESDTFSMLFRVALFDDVGAGLRYLSAPPARVFRLTPREPVGERRQNVPALRPRAEEPTEADLGPSLEALEAAVRKVEGLTSPSTPVTYRDLDGFKCLAQESNCLGDNHDTTYATAIVGRMAPGDRLFVLGVNHAAAGKATYANVSVYQIDNLLGVAAVDDRAFVGTAKAYVPDDPNADKLFVWQLARDCADIAQCTEIPEAFPGLASKAAAAVAFRAYLEPSSLTAPSPDTILLERVIKVSAP